MDWYRELYDDFRMKHGFGSIPESRTAKEVDFLVEELGLRKGSKVLDLCCGTGRHSVELARRGIHAVGVEWNTNYVSIAQTKAAEAAVRCEFICGDVREADLGRDYDAAILMYQSFGYQTDPEDRKILLRTHQALRPDGRFLIELLNRDSILMNFQPSSDREVDGVKVVEEREFDVLTSRVNATITRYEGGAARVQKVSWRMYSAHEIKGICEGVGFRFLAGYSSIDRAPLTVETRLMRLVFQKR